MLGVGLIWVLVQGWQLTLVGFAIAPVFAVTMAVQTNLASKCEVRNKRACESVAKGYYEVCCNMMISSLLQMLTTRYAGHLQHSWHSLYGIRTYLPDAVRQGN
jgi:hypothetical protein